MQFASEPLRNDVFGYHPWKRKEKQEDRNIPKEMSDPNGEGASGLAHDPTFDNVLLPLYTFINQEKDIDLHDAHSLAVLEFFEKVASRAQSIEELTKQTKKFLSNPKYIYQFLPRQTNTSQ